MINPLKLLKPETLWNLPIILFIILVILLIFFAVAYSEQQDRICYEHHGKMFQDKCLIEVEKGLYIGYNIEKVNGEWVMIK